MSTAFWIYTSCLHIKKQLVTFLKENFVILGKSMNYSPIDSVLTQMCLTQVSFPYPLMHLSS